MHILIIFDYPLYVVEGYYVFTMPVKSTLFNNLFHTSHTRRGDLMPYCSLYEIWRVRLLQLHLPLLNPSPSLQVYVCAC